MIITARCGGPTFGFPCFSVELRFVGLVQQGRAIFSNIPTAQWNTGCSPITREATKTHNSLYKRVYTIYKCDML